MIRLTPIKPWAALVALAWIVSDAEGPICYYWVLETAAGPTLVGFN